MTDHTRLDDAVRIERTFDAPVELIWALWTDPEHHRRWFGPEGASISVAQMDLRVGGRRLVRMEMETPNGPTQMWFAGEFLEIVEHRRLVYTEAVSDESGTLPAVGDPALTEVRVELEAAGDRTTMVLTHVGVPADSPGASGWTMAFDKLAAYLVELAAD